MPVMGMEQRDGVRRLRTELNSQEEDILTTTKPFTIPKGLVMQAYKLIKANAGAAGVDRQSLENFEKDLKNNLYKIWNKLSSGSYFPPPVKAVVIQKKQGGERVLGVPTVSDRIAQMVVKLTFEPMVEPHFFARLLRLSAEQIGSGRRRGDTSAVLALRLVRGV